MSRLAGHWRGQEQHALEPADEATHCRAGHESGGAGHQKRGRPVQLAGDGARRLRGGRGIDTHWVEGGLGRRMSPRLGTRVSSYV